MVSRFVHALLAASFPLTAAQGASAEAGHPTIEVVAASDRCTIIWTGSSSSRELAVGIPAPCRIHKDLSGKVRYRMQDGRSIALIESSSPDPSRGNSCLTQIRGVRFDHASVTLSGGVSKVASCPPFQWDDKMFTGLF